MPISFKDILIGIKRYFLSVAVSDRYQDECVREHIHSHAEACLGSSTTKRKTYVALSELRQLLPAYSKEDIRIALVESGWSFDQRSNRQWIFRKSGRK
jgi:hypothetical protein